MTLTIDQVASLLPSWQGRRVNVQPISGGLTNTNFRVEVDGTPRFVRIPGQSTELLAIDRPNEIHNARAAAQAGVSPRLLEVLTPENVMVFEFIQGQTMSIESLQAEGMPTRIADSLRRLHAGPRFLQDFDMFRLVEFYLSICDDHQVRIPDGYRAQRSRVAQVEQALRRNALPTVPCHNDLLAENYIDDGRQLWLIDFEYSGNNDPCFELGNTCQELQYDQARFAELCAAYFGQATPSHLARMRLFALMSDVGWTLWGAIQAKISTLDYDFWDYTLSRWNRALAILNGSEIARWLDEA